MEKKNAIIIAILLALLCSLTLLITKNWKIGGVLETSSAPAAEEPEPSPPEVTAGAAEAPAQPTEEPAAPVEAPEETPAPAQAAPGDSRTTAEKNEALCRTLAESFRDAGDLSYVQFFPRRGEGVFAQQGGNLTIGLPLDYAERIVDVIIYFDPGFFPVYGRSRYESDREVNTFFQEDIVDIIMDNNPGAVVVTVSSDNRLTVISYMLRCLEKLGITSCGKIICSGWSAGGNFAVSCAAILLRDYPALGEPVIVLNDCNHTPDIDGAIYDILEDSGVPCLVFSTMEHAVTEHRLYRLVNCRLPIAVIHVDLALTEEFNTHLQRRLLAISDNVYGYVLGTLPELPGNMYGASYRYGRHDAALNDTVWSSAQEVYEQFFGNGEA